MSTALTGVGVNRFSVQNVDVSSVNTETAVVLFQLGVGAFGALAGILAARRLSRVDGQINTTSLLLPIGIAGASTVLGAFLLPGGA